VSSPTTLATPVAGYARGVSAYEPGSTPIGWVGTGVMGTSMCGHLLAGGYPVTVYSRTRERAEPLLQRGATWADSPAELAANSDVVFSMVSDDGALTAAVDEAIAANPAVVAKIREGKVAAAGVLVGAVMKATRGQADAARLRELILERLS